MNLHLQALVAQRDEFLKAIAYFDHEIVSRSTNPEITRAHLDQYSLNSRQVAALDQQIFVELELERAKRPFYKRIFSR